MEFEVFAEKEKSLCHGNEHRKHGKRPQVSYAGECQRRCRAHGEKRHEFTRISRIRIMQAEWCRPGAAFGHRLGPDPAGKRACRAKQASQARFPAGSGPRRCNAERWPLAGQQKSSGLMPVREIRSAFQCSPCALFRGMSDDLLVAAMPRRVFRGKKLHAGSAPLF